MQEYILLSISRPPTESDYICRESVQGTESPLSLLESVFPYFSSLVSRRRVLDFGCGFGCQCIALTQKYDCVVVGVESNPGALRKAIDNAKDREIGVSRLSFVDKISDDMLGQFDVVISQNSFEHFENPTMVLEEMKSLICTSGRLLITFGPPWLAPYGSHMHFFCKVPWINVVFSERTVMNVRRLFRDDDAKQYQDVESGLNKMTVRKFEQIVQSSDLLIENRIYGTVKGIDFLSKIPILREFFINQISVSLSIPTIASTQKKK